MFRALVPSPAGDGWGTPWMWFKEQLRAVPRRGLGYGALRYLARHPALAAQPTPQISLNYLGQFDQALPAGGLLHAMRRGLDADTSPHTPPAHPLDVVAPTQNKCLPPSRTHSARHHHPRPRDSLCAPPPHPAPPHPRGRAPPTHPNNPPATPPSPSPPSTGPASPSPPAATPSPSCSPTTGPAASTSRRLR